MTGSFHGGIADDAETLRLLAGLFTELRRTRPATDEAIRAVAARLAAATRRRAARYDVAGRGVTTPSIPDLALATRAREGDSDAVRQVWATLQGVVTARIYGMGLARFEQELSEALMDRLWDKLPLYNGAGNATLRTWAWTVTGNAIRNWIRDRKTGDGRNIGIEDEQAAVALAAPSQFAADFELGESEREASCRRMSERIARVARETLKPEEWELIQRVIVRGERYETISAELNEMPGTLRARVFRALQRLRGPLAAELGQEAREYFAAISEKG